MLLRTELPYRADSAALFETVADLPWAVFLDSGAHHLTESRYDIIAAEPHTTLVTHGKLTEIRSDAIELSREDPLTLLRRHLDIDPASACDLPFTGGALGYLGFNRESQLSILIRAAVQTEQTIYFNVGAGIVADSNAAAEYDETIAKASGFLAALNLQPQREYFIPETSAG
mgnify:CR=1 FL=1